MLDGLLGRGFSSKCKSLIKLTRTRIDVIRRNKDARQRIMRKDIADLLSNGLDINAFGRTEELSAGLNVLFCYDFIEQSCEFILKQLSIMQKQSECPEECRETVASLMFAAARFSDLPELRDLRDMFQDRYGNSLEYFVNQKFFERLAPKPPTMEKKIQLLEEIASEFSIKWDSRGFQKRMATPAFTQDQPGKYGPFLVADDKYKLPNGKDTAANTVKRDVSSKEKSEHVHDRHRLRDGIGDNILKRDGLDVQNFGRQEFTENRHKPLSGREERLPKREITTDNVPHTVKRDFSSKEKSEHVHDRHRMRDGIGDSILKRDGLDVQIFGRQEFTENRHKPLSGREETVPEREITADKRRPFNGKEETTSKTRRSGSSSHRNRPEFADGGHKLHNDGVIPERRWDPISHGKPEVPESCAGVPFKSKDKDVSFGAYDRGVEQNIGSSTKKHLEEESDGQKSYYNNAFPPPYTKSKDNVIPPPYIKSKEKKHGISSDRDYASSEPSTHDRSNGVVNLSERNHAEPEHLIYDRHVVGPERVNSRDREKDPYYNRIPLPKPRSVRRKHLKSSSSRDDYGDSEDAGVPKRSSSSRRENSRRGLQILFDDKHTRKDEEERVIDKLLLHYSKKASTYEPGMLRRKSKAQIATDSGGGSRHGRSRDELDAELDMGKMRSVSLPHEQATPSEGAKKVFARANSFQPDNQARHVHPKLPDYDDLAARFAALRGR